MLITGDNKRGIRLIKDVLLLALSCWLVGSPRILPMLLGLFGLFFYGRDAWRQARALWQEKTASPRNDSRPKGTDEEKITVTDLSDAKEVDYEKE